MQREPTALDGLECMEGALPSVVGGLVSIPAIAVPRRSVRAEARRGRRSGALSLCTRGTRAPASRQWFFGPIHSKHSICGF